MKEVRYQCRFSKKSWQRFLEAIKNQFDKPSEALRYLVNEYSRKRLVSQENSSK